MDQAGHSGRAVPGRASAAGLDLVLAVAALLFTFAMLEFGVRTYVDFDEFTPRPIRFIDPEVPIRFEPHRTWTYETREFSYTVRFNAFGRRDVEWAAETIADPRNILFIGDSFVLGNGVEYEQTIPTLLEARIAAVGPAREVFNFGMPDGNPSTYEQLLTAAVEGGFAARTVVVGTFIGNDYYDRRPRAAPAAAAPAAEKKAAPKWRPRSAFLRFMKLRVSQSPRMIGWAFAAGRALGISVYETSGSYIFLRDPTEDQAAAFQSIVDVFGQMKRRCQGDDRELLVVIFPNKIQVENGEDLTSGIFDAARPNRLIMEYCQREGIRCLDLLPILVSAYRAGGEPLYYPVDRHLNPRGTAVAADAIAGFLGAPLDPGKPSNFK